MNKLSKFNFFGEPQNIIAVGVTIISLCALLVSLKQTSILKEQQELMRKHSKASVWPNLEVAIGKGHNKEDRSICQFEISLNNSGIGPAIITDVKISYNDTTSKNWWHLFEIQEIPDSIEKYISNRGFNGKVLQAGENIEILNLDDNLPLANAFYERLKGVSIEIYYESIYEEKWKNCDGVITKLDNFEGLPDEEQFH